MKKKLIIIDDHRIIREGLKITFKKNEQFEVVADFDNETELLSFMESNQADIILMDVHLSTGNGMDMAVKVKKNFPHIKVLMHSMSDDPYNISLAKNIGCDGYVLKSAGQKGLQHALEAVSNGNEFYLKESE